MEWVLKLEARSGWGEVETIEVGRLDRRVSGLTADEVGMTLGREEPARRTWSSDPSDPGGGIYHLRSCLRRLPETSASP
jgi:hypothetical protein